MPLVPRQRVLRRGDGARGGVRDASRGGAVGDASSRGDESRPGVVESSRESGASTVSRDDDGVDSSGVSRVQGCVEGGGSVGDASR